MADSPSTSTPASPVLDTKPIVADSQADTTVPPADRSRNAKAQARHRAKRKAYIEHLESTVTNLKAALSRVGGQDGLDTRVQQLTQENTQLRAEIQSLRSQVDILTASSHTRRLTPPMSANISTISLDEDDSKFPLVSASAASKKRKLSDDLGDPSHLGSDQQQGFNISSLGLAPIRAPPHIHQHHVPLNLNVDVTSSMYNGLGLHRQNSSTPNNNNNRSLFSLGGGLPPPPQYHGSQLTRNSLLSSPALLTPLSGVQGPPTPSTPSYALGRSPDQRHLPGLPTPISATRDSMVRSSFLSQLDAPLVPSSAPSFQQSFMSLPSPFPRSAPSKNPATSPNTSTSSLSSHPPSPMTPPQHLDDQPDHSNSKLQLPMSAIGMSQPSPFGRGSFSANPTPTSSSFDHLSSAPFDWTIGLSQEASGLHSLTSGFTHSNGLSLLNSAASNASAGGYPFPRVINGVGAGSMDDNGWGNSSIVVTDMSAQGQGQSVAN